MDDFYFLLRDVLYVPTFLSHVAFITGERVKWTVYFNVDFKRLRKRTAENR